MEGGFNGFGHQRIGDGHRKVDICGPLHWPGIKMRSHLRIIHLRNGGDFLGLPDAA